MVGSYTPLAVLCRGLPLVGVRLENEKAQESVSVTVLPSEASRIALFLSDGNAEAHACICNDGIKPAFLADGNTDDGCSISIWAPTVAQSLTLTEKFARNFNQSRISADKRFQNYISSDADNMASKQSLPL